MLVVWGAGFAGSNLAEELLAAGEDVVVLDNVHNRKAYTFNQTTENSI
jgi:nucleoside-diphosphate-sugar epimerase